MKYKYSIIAGMLSIFLGFIPISIKKTENINYVIYAKTLQQANHIKNELISFYKEKCYAADCFNINKKIIENIDDFVYDAEYKEYTIYVDAGQDYIKMIGCLYKTAPSSITFKNYFTSSASSIPEATSINVDTSSLSDQI